jgi:hypothetical protein
LLPFLLLLLLLWPPVWLTLTLLTLTLLTLTLLRLTLLG